MIRDIITLGIGPGASITDLVLYGFEAIILPNDSTTGGFVTQTTAGPLEGQALLAFIQQWVVGITGIDGTLVRPRWQTEPPNIPQQGNAWAAIGIHERRGDEWPVITHLPNNDSGLGEDGLQRHEELDVLCSFYDLGVSGLADLYASLLRDGAMIPQNCEYLTSANFGLGRVGNLVSVPSLLKQRWMYRVDLLVILRRQINRTYPIRNLVSAQGTVKTDTGFTRPFSSP